MPLSLGGEPVVIDYGTRDYEGFREDALALALTLTPEWNDHSPGDLGVVLTELFAYMADILSFHAERCLNESFVGSAVQRRSMINLGRMVGYELRPASAAIVDLEFTTDAAGVIPARTQVTTIPQETTEQAILFETLEDYIAPSAGTYTIGTIQGRSIINELIGSGDDTASQRFELAYSPLAIDPEGVASLRVDVNEGAGWVPYSVVDSFADSEPDDRHVSYEIDEFDQTTIIGGNGVRGRVIAAGTDNVRATYRVGGGAAGNKVGTNRITNPINAPALVTSVTNLASPLGGKDKESVDEARINIPASVEALGRAVTYNDFAYFATNISGIAQARAARGLGPYEVLVYVAAVGEDPTVPGTWDPVAESGTGLLGSVGDYLTERRVAPVKLDVRNFTVVDIELRYRLRVGQGFYQDEVDSAVRERLLNDVASQSLGNELLLAYLDWSLTERSKVPGLEGIIWERFARIAASRLTNPDPLSGATLPDVTWTITPLNVGDDYPSFALVDGPRASPEERWEIRFINATQYEVRGEHSGLQSTLGQLGVEWTSDLGNLTLLAAAGVNPVYNGVKYEITVGSGPLSSKINIGDFEAFRLQDDNIHTVEITGGIEL